MVVFNKKGENPGRIGVANSLSHSELREMLGGCENNFFSPQKPIKKATLFRGCLHYQTMKKI
jgi:hypothetical protein